MEQKDIFAKSRDCRHVQPGRECSYHIPAKEKDEPAWIAWVISAAIILGVVITAMILFGCFGPEEGEPTKIEPQSAVKLLRQQHHELSPWEELEMAIIWTESRGNPMAVGAAGDLGLFQITKIYVEEINRVAGTDYRHDDALEPATAKEMIETMQQFKNPGRDFELAVYYHNKSPEYLNRVEQNLEFVRRYEAVRKIVKE